METGDDHVQRLIVGGYAVALNIRGAACVTYPSRSARDAAGIGNIAGVFIPGRSNDGRDIGAGRCLRWALDSKKRGK